MKTAECPAMLSRLVLRSGSGIRFAIAAALVVTAVTSCPAESRAAAGLRAAFARGSTPDAIAVKREAFEAFRRGENAVGIAALKTLVDSDDSGRAAELQWTAVAGEVAFFLKNAGESRKAAVVATLALEKAGAAKERLSGSELADLYVWIGELNEEILGRSDEACRAYEVALSIRPALPNAKRRAARLRGVENEAKAQAQSRQNEKSANVR